MSKQLLDLLQVFLRFYPSVLIMAALLLVFLLLDFETLFQILRVGLELAFEIQ